MGVHLVSSTQTRIGSDCEMARVSISRAEKEEERYFIFFLLRSEMDTPATKNTDTARGNGSETKWTPVDTLDHK